MQRREFLKATGGAVFALASTGSVLSAKAPDADPKPNLLFVFSDQQSWDMLGCYGNEQIKTPNIDKLAGDGLRFNHCVSSCPVCTPYRSILLSGQHPLYNGCLVNDIQMLPPKGSSFADMLNTAGYYTGYVGKWHLYGGVRTRGIPAGPMRYGFDNEFFTNNCDLNYWADKAFYWSDDNKRVKLGKFESDGQTDQALEFLDKHAGKKPFALFVSWHPPHNWGWGYPAPEKYEKLYDADKIKLRPGCADTKKIRRDYRGHMALCTNVDDNFGRLIAKLEAKNVADNTIVVFTSDHGDILRSHGIREHKSHPQQISCRVPLILRMGSKIKPRVSDMLIGLLDLMPTMLGLMGIKPPKTCQGSDYSKAIMAGRDEVTESVPMFFWGKGSDWRGVYTHRYTYAFQLIGGRKRINVLFDRKNDPYELKNLFGSSEHKDLQARLHAMTLDWMKKFKDEHLPWETVKHQIYVDPAAAKARWEPYHVKSAALKGRPIDLIHK
jgi:arylsulfatase A-like enzyme